MPRNLRSMVVRLVSRRESEKKRKREIIFISIATHKYEQRNCFEPSPLRELSEGGGKEGARETSQKRSGPPPLPRRGGRSQMRGDLL